MSTDSCVGCKFLYGYGTGYSSYTWEETYVHCALDKNTALKSEQVDEGQEQPFDWPPENSADDEWLPTIHARCDSYAEGDYYTRDPDGEDHPADIVADVEQIAAICKHAGIEPRV